MSTALTPERMTSRAPSHTVDFDLHGFLGLRLIDPPAAGLHRVSRELGPAVHRLDRAPDLVVRWVETLPELGPLHYLGRKDFGVTPDGSLVQTTPSGKSLIPLAALAPGAEIVCERAVHGPPLLRPILNTLALSRGYVAAHASAFTYADRGVLVTGWPHGSKTGTLLAFMAEGARLIGDDCIYVDQEGARMCGLPEPLGVRETYFRQLPNLAARLGKRRRTHLARLRGIHAAARVLLGSSSAPLPARLLDALESRLKTFIRPQELFGEEACTFAGPLDQVCVLQSTSDPAIRIVPADPDLVAEQMLMALRGEIRHLSDSYTRLRFARPELRNPLLEEVETLHRKALQQALFGKAVFQVSHPHGVPAPELFRALRRSIEE